MGPRSAPVQLECRGPAAANGRFLMGQKYTCVAGAGRNDDCPCGSGKKYKKCCLTQGMIHLTMNTGHTRVSKRSEVSASTTQYLTRRVREAPLMPVPVFTPPKRKPAEMAGMAWGTPGTKPLRCFDIPTPMDPTLCLVTLGEEGRGYDTFSVALDGLPMLFAVLCPSIEASKEAWANAVTYYQEVWGATVPVPPVPVESPWLVVVLTPPAMMLLPSSLLGRMADFIGFMGCMGDFERCLGWVLLDGKLESRKEVQ